MRGVPLTPEQLQKLAAVYTTTGNYAEAGRAIGVDTSVARRALLSHLRSDRVTLNELAVERGLKDGCEHLISVIKETSLKLKDAEIGKLSDAANALTKSSEALINLIEQPAKAKLLRLQVKQKKLALKTAELEQNKLIAETEALRKSSDRKPLTKEELDELFAQHFGGKPGADPKE